jgi:hypothetical protein
MRPCHQRGKDWTPLPCTTCSNTIPGYLDGAANSAGSSLLAFKTPLPEERNGAKDLAVVV